MSDGNISLSALRSVNLSEKIATEPWVKENFLSVDSLEGYISKTDLSSAISGIAEIPDDGSASPRDILHKVNEILQNLKGLL